MVSQYINLGLRGLQFLWVLLIMAIDGNMISNATSGNPSVVNYAMFLAVIALIALIYLIPATLKEKFAIHPMILIAVDLLLTLLFFCGGVAFAAELGVHSCNNVAYLNTNSITNGAVNKSMRCHEGQAVTAFLWFAWSAFAASTVLSAFSSRGNLTKGSSSGPAMSEV